MRGLWFIVMAGCATSDVANDEKSGVEVTLPDDSGEPGSDDTAPPGSPEDTAEPTDDEDGDGHTIGDGDCDDDDADVHPGAIDDTCDGIDQNCDGTVDEGVTDAYEPNDIDAHDLGNLSEVPETILTGLITTEADVDIFTFEIEDVFGVWFSIEVELDGIASDLDPGLQLLWVTGPEGSGLGIVSEADEHAFGQPELIRYTGDGLGDDSGSYEVVVHSMGGSNCSEPYSLAIRTRQPPWE